jgi:hypothetical protein
MLPGIGASHLLEAVVIALPPPNSMLGVYDFTRAPHADASLSALRRANHHKGGKSHYQRARARVASSYIRLHGYCING